MRAGNLTFRPVDGALLVVDIAKRDKRVLIVTESDRLLGNAAVGRMVGGYHRPGRDDDIGKEL